MYARKVIVSEGDSSKVQRSVYNPIMEATWSSMAQSRKDMTPEELDKDSTDMDELLYGRKRVPARDRAIPREERVRERKE